MLHRGFVFHYSPACVTSNRDEILKSSVWGLPRCSAVDGEGGEGISTECVSVEWLKIAGAAGESCTAHESREEEDADTEGKKRNRQERNKFQLKKNQILIN